MATIPCTLKFNLMGEWARQHGLFKLRDTYVSYGVRGLINLNAFWYVLFTKDTIYLTNSDTTIIMFTIDKNLLN